VRIRRPFRRGDDDNSPAGDDHGRYDDKRCGCAAGGGGRDRGGGYPRQPGVPRLPGRTRRLFDEVPGGVGGRSRDRATGSPSGTRTTSSARLSLPALRGRGQACRPTCAR
jgi:hypothetical protein